MAYLQFVDLYNLASRWAGDTSSTGVARAKDAVVEANHLLSYGMQQPALKPWWRKREDTITPVAATQAYTITAAGGQLESMHEVWYRIKGDRFTIDLVDDDDWQKQANENTSVTGTPDICNLFSDAGDVYKLRFSPMPSTGFINTIDNGNIKYDYYIEETLVAGSADTVEPLMPNSRRMGIAYKAVELLAALQGDLPLLQWAASLGNRYYLMVVADDDTRLGAKTRQSRPMDPIGLRNLGSGARMDYGHVKP